MKTVRPKEGGAGMPHPQRGIELPEPETLKQLSQHTSFHLTLE